MFEGNKLTFHKCRSQAVNQVILNSKFYFKTASTKNISQYVKSISLNNKINPCYESSIQKSISQ